MSNFVDEIVNDVKIELDDNSVKDTMIIHYVEKAVKMASNISGFDDLPTEFAPYIVDTVVEALNRRLNEGISQKSAVGVSTTFIFKDMEKSLASKLRGKRNPQKLVGKHGSNKWS